MFIDENDYPSLFILSDTASKDAQRIYLILSSLNIVFIIVASVLGSISIASGEGKSIVAYISAIILIISTFLTIFIGNQNKEKDWYDGRAVAESVKTRTWRFMMRSDPYGELLAMNDAKSLFLEILEGIISERADLIGKISSYDHGEEQITEKMVEIRTMNFLDRKEIYLNSRIENQRIWYLEKSKFNGKRGRIWQGLFILTQSLAFLFSLLTIHFPQIPINGVGIFTTISASALAWTQLKKHRKLENSYGVAAQ